MIDLDSLDIPTWVNWVAQDQSGAIWGYSVEPLQNHQGWYENEVGQIIKITDTTPNSDWQLSLTKIT